MTLVEPLKGNTFRSLDLAMFFISKWETYGKEVSSFPSVCASQPGQFKLG